MVAKRELPQGIGKKIHTNKYTTVYMEIFISVFKQTRKVK
jgi:hypothetical protein